MHEPGATAEHPPWYRQGWPWALIALPASAVIGGIITIVLAVQSPNALVVDDYYKQGLAINQQKQRVAKAAALQLKGLARYDGTRIQLTLESTAVLQPDTLRLQVIHTTRAELDREVSLQPDGDRYSARLEELEHGNWYLRLRPRDEAWEIRSKVTNTGSFQTLLTARE